MANNEINLDTNKIRTKITELNISYVEPRFYKYGLCAGEVYLTYVRYVFESIK